MFSDQTLQTIITTIGGLFVALITYVGGRSVIDRNRRNREASEPEEEREAIERYRADPSTFIKDVLESNKQLTDEVRGYRDEIKELRKDVAALRERDTKFRGALARWLIRIMDRFTEHGVEMPLPDEHDAELLSDVIPSALEATRPPRPRPA